MARFRDKRKKQAIGKRGLIICEGETEENYFKGLISQDKYKRKFQAIDVNIFKPKDHSPLGLVKEAKRQLNKAKRERNSYNFVWIVFDKDGHAKVPEAFETARTNNPEINIAFTAPCFEFFVLLHFEKTTKPFSKCDSVISQIKKKWLPNYEKATNIYEEIYEFKDFGSSNSKWVQERAEVDLNDGKRIYNLSAYSNIHEIIEFLYSLV